MKNIVDIVKEGLRINKNIKIKINKEGEYDFKHFKDEILDKYDLKYEEFDKFCDLYNNSFVGPWGNNNAIKELKFKLIKSQDEDNEELFRFGADLINHPSRIKKYTSFDHVYTNAIIDLTILYHENDDLGDFLYFLDYKHDSYDIYQLIK